MNQPLSSIMSEDWAAALAPVEEQIHAMGAFLREEHAAGYRTFPPAADIFNAFRRPMSQVKVLIIGQDPYPTPGNAMGLSFSVHRGMPLPRSLNNIYKELQDDLGIAPADHGDLSCWADEGVMLLNRVLTVRESDAGSHRGKVGRRLPSALSVHWWRVTSRWWVCCGVRMRASAHPCCSRTRAWSRRILRRYLLVVVSLGRARFRR